MFKFISKVFFIICFIFCINTQVFASESGFVFFYKNSLSGLDELKEEIFFNGSFTTLEKNIILYENLFDSNNDELITCIPKDTRLLAATFEDSHLKINISSQIKNYGGNATEEAVFSQLINTAFSIPEVSMISIYIDGYIDTLPEGSYLQNIRR